MTQVNRSIGKIEVGLIICVSLVGLLAVSSIWFSIRNNILQNRIDAFETETYNLQNQMSSLTNEKNNLENQIDTITIEKEDLQDEVESLTTDVDNLQSEIEWLNYRYDNYVTNHEYSNWEYEDIQFYFYYVEPEQKFGVYDLDDDLFGWEWYIPYEEGVFDCSEMSAYLEWYLENEGWNTLIVVGDSPIGSGYHAWLLVETSEGAYMPVESTTAEIVWWEDQYFDNYWIYDDTFETIQDALAYYETEFDWWM